MNTSEANPGPVVYAEPGATWWPVLWGPVFAVIGAVIELLTPGSSNYLMWLLLAVFLGGATALWVYARRKICSVRLSSTMLAQGREKLPVERIAAVQDVGAPAGARVLGGAWVVPKGTAEVPLRLTDDTVVLAWARDPVAFAEALRSLTGEL